MLRRLVKHNTVIRHAMSMNSAPIAMRANQQRFRRVVVYSDKPKLTTENAVKGLEQYLGAKEDYVTKYPNITVEQYDAQLREQLNRPIYQDPNSAEYVTSLLGFNKEEVGWAMSGKYPDLFEWKGQDLYVNWDVVGKMFSRTDTEKGLMADIESGFKKFKLVEEELSNLDEINIDWKQWEADLGADVVKQVREDLHDAIEQMRPDLNVDKFDEAVSNLMQPYIDQTKDLLIDDLEEVKTITDDLVRESQFLKEDEYGEPIIQFDSPYFLDKFAPEERDEMILEIENGEWDTDYQKEIKAARFSPDELIEYNKQWLIEQSSEIEEDAIKNLVGEGAMSERQQREQLLFSEVNSAAKRTKQLETEVNQLKTKLEFEAESAAADQDKSKKKEERSGRLSDQEWNAFLAKRGVAEGSNVSRDFKHMSAEQVKEWEARSLASRNEAEKNLASVTK
jgi:hypothetical protein